MHDPRGRLIGFSQIIRDLTERNQAEEAIQVTRAQMAHIARVTTLGELTASIAHEINQPLSAVVTLGNAALRWLSSQPPNLPEAREAVSRGVHEANRAAEVIAGIRALAKKAKPTKTRLDLNEAIREVLALTELHTDKNHIVVQTELADPLPQVSGSKVELQQVILNLVSNAVDSMTSLVDRPRVLLVRSEFDKRGVMVTVRDSGVGVPPEQMGNIFDAFFTTKPTGMGMGLSISRSIIEAHDGTLWATPNPTGGMTFQFALAPAA
jgi:C4-dicarboxylate-specific signal transduction histidine kinase